MKEVTKLVLIMVVALNTTGCAKLWPYKSDFDCPTPKGVQCTPLYEINKMADAGKFTPGAIDDPQETPAKKEVVKKSFCCGKNIKGRD